MSVRALEEEYKKVCEQYKEMLTDIKDIEKEVAEGIVAPEFVDRLQEQIKPIKQNYEWWSYVMYVLHQPQRKNKEPKYRQQNKKLLQSLSEKNTPEARLEEGKTALNGLKGMKSGRTT